MSDDRLIELLKNAKRVAIVGLSTDPSKESHAIAQYLKQEGYEVIGINPNPKLKEIFTPAYTSLSEIPPSLSIDIVNFFLPAEKVPPVVEEALQRGVKGIWLQEGIRSEKAQQQAREKGVTYVEDTCIRAFHTIYLKKGSRRERSDS